MANYLTLALDPTIGAYMDFMTAEGAGTGPLLKQLLISQKQDLEDILKSRNMTMLQLFKSLAVS